MVLRLAEMAIERERGRVLRGDGHPAAPRLHTNSAMMALNSPEFMILRTSSAEKSRYFAADMSASQPSAVMIELTTAGSTRCSFV